MMNTSNNGIDDFDTEIFSGGLADDSIQEETQVIEAIDDDAMEATLIEDEIEIMEEDLPTPDRKEKKNSGSKIKIIIAVVVLAFIGFIAWLFLGVYFDLKSQQSQEVKTANPVEPIASISIKDAPEKSLTMGEENEDESLSPFPPSTTKDEKQEKSINDNTKANEEDEGRLMVNIPDVEDIQEDIQEHNKRTAKEEKTKKENTETPKPVVVSKKINTDKETEIDKEEVSLYSSQTKTQKNGGVCVLSTEYEAGKEYVYYVLTGTGYVPAFKKDGWDKKGLVVHKKEVALGFDKMSNFTEIEKGKFLPSEMFSNCSTFQK